MHDVETVNVHLISLVSKIHALVIGIPWPPNSMNIEHESKKGD